MLASLLLCGSLVATGAGPDGADPSEAADRAAYETASAAAGRNADAHVALALWCEAHGMPAEKSRHLARAVLLDPSHAKARGLLGLVKHDGKWMRPEEVSRSVEESPEFQALFREYLHRRTEAGDRSDDQYKLARWCDEKGLKQQATAHYHRVIELDPGRDSAWKHLGFKKVSGRWIKPEVAAAAKAEAEAQAKADKVWKPKLERLKSALSSRDKARKAEAEAALAAIDDPRAVPMVWQVFARGSERMQHAAAGVFGRIDAPSASSALAMMAVFSPFGNVRSEAAQLLTRRDPREFGRLLVGLLGDEIKYKKKNVAGPGSQGELLVEGKDVDVRRLYTPLEDPLMQIQPGDQFGTDANGRTVLTRTAGGLWFGRRVPAQWLMALAMRPSPSASWFLQTYPLAPAFTRPGPRVSITSLPNANLASLLQGAGLSLPQNGEAANRISALSTSTPLSLAPASGIHRNVTPLFQDFVQIPIEQMAAEAQASADVAQHQLQQDAEWLEARNAPVRQTNERVSAILRAVSGQDHGSDRDQWIEWVCDVEGYGAPLKVASSKTTLVEPVPLDYQPQALPIQASTSMVGFIVGPSCFAGGTLVRTLRGARPIEEVQVGDQVLTQDTTTGRLGYQPVVSVFHNPPNWTYRIDLGGESVHPTGIHRFWKAGGGWIMARDVKVGDRLRTIGGTVEVVAVSKDKVQPVFNLLLSGGDNYCVGELGVVAHDNGFVDPVEHPFDAVPALAAAAGSTPRP